jgi:hypothetical protein
MKNTVFWDVATDVSEEHRKTYTRLLSVTSQYSTVQYSTATAIRTSNLKIKNRLRKFSIEMRTQLLRLRREAHADLFYGTDEP